MLLATVLFNTRWSRNLQSIITLVTTNRSSVHWSRIKNLKRRPLLLIFLLLLRGPQREPGVSWHDHQSWRFSSWSLSQSSNMVITSNIVFYIIRIYVCISVLLPSRAKIHPPRERGRGNAGTPAWKWRRWWVIHWGRPENVYFPMWILTIVHISLSSPQPFSASEFGSRRIIPFLIFENIQNYSQVSISRPLCIYR